MNHAYSSRWQVVAICAALFVLTVILYSPVRYFEFINYDDGDYITKNPHVRSGLNGDNVVWAFTAFYSNNWHPLTWISHMLDVQMFGLNAGGHHLVNVVFHACNTVLLLLVF